MTVPAVSDRTLAERHRYGDPEAFAELYRAYERMVFNLALRLSGDRERAADLSQEIFLRVYRHLDRFRGRSSLKTWIYRVAVNHCRSRLRPRALRIELFTPSREDEDPLAEVADSRRGPEELAMAGDAERALRAALAELPRSFREAVVLRDLEGLAYDEIAEVLGVKIGTVRSRIARGRRRLSELLGPPPDRRQAGAGDGGRGEP
ncbi:MAG: sigma-70 family RNA polymerase sigma factor [Acidobacteriota bacterium]|jgi:RNA polymerase sigma-70 factor (ECF subfamily)